MCLLHAILYLLLLNRRTLMKFNQKLSSAIFIRRYKRFLVDVRLGNEDVTVYCPNTGSMKGCFSPDCEVLLSKSDNPKRKYSFTLEMTKPESHWVGVNTGLTNKLVKEALLNAVISEIGVVEKVQPEIKVSKHSRLDFLIYKDGRKVYMEVKNCSLAENGIAKFPDAVTVRGTKHLNELIRLRELGHEAFVLFCVQRQDAKFFSPAWKIDEVYSKTLCKAVDAGVQALAYRADVGPDGIIINQSLSVNLGQ